MTWRSRLAYRRLASNAQGTHSRCCKKPLSHALSSQNPLSSVTRSRSRVTFVHGLSASELEATSCKSNDLALAAVFAALTLVLGFDCLFADLPDHLHDVFGLVNGLEQTLVAALEKLEEGPDSDMLEGGVARGKESSEVAMNTTRGLVP